MSEEGRRIHILLKQLKCLHDTCVGSGKKVKERQPEGRIINY